MNMNLSKLFAPQSIAVVGASEDTARLGGGTIMNFMQRHGYKGRILPINPKRAKIAGLTCYTSLAAAPGPIDLAVFAIPAQILNQTLAEIPVGHVKVALVLSSGFGEMGEEGRRLEEEVVKTARERGIAMVGPNSVGAVNAWIGLAPTISQFYDKQAISAGPLALVSQSGAFGTALLAQSEQEGLDFGYFVSSGNESQLEFSDFARYLIAQDNVKILCGYLESIRDGATFVDLAFEAQQRGKPLILLKVGSTEAGAMAAQSHTGALVGSDAITQVFFDALNVVRADDGEDLLDLLRVFQRTPTSRGKRLAILSHSGGAGVMAADAAHIAGADIRPLAGDLIDRLAKLLPAFASLKNPLDMTGGASLNGKLMANCLREVLSHADIDAAVLCVNLIWREGEVLMKELAAVAAELDKPFVVSWIAPRPEIAEALRHAPYPVFGDPARAAQALMRRINFDAKRKHPQFVKGTQRPATLLAKPHSKVPEAGEDRNALLRDYGIQLPKQMIALTADEAIQFKRGSEHRIALKIASADIAHRTEIGAVAIGLQGENEIRQAYESILKAAKTHHPDARIDGVLAQEMISGVEVLVSFKRDPVFGPVVVFGPGGVLVELIGRVETCPAPISSAHVSAVIQSSVLGRLLNGYRGGPRLDGEALASLIERVSWMAADQPAIREVELNPVMVLPAGQGCVAVDYKIVV